jgi:hypothetical protein
LYFHYLLCFCANNNPHYIQVTPLFQIFGPDISDEARGLIQLLCAKDPRKRMCCSPGNGVEQLRSHSFFIDFDWMNLFCRRIPSPFRGLVGRIQVDER